MCRQALALLVSVFLAGCTFSTGPENPGGGSPGLVPGMTGGMLGSTPSSNQACQGNYGKGVDPGSLKSVTDAWGRNYPREWPWGQPGNQGIERGLINNPIDWDKFQMTGPASLAGAPGMPMPMVPGPLISPRGVPPLPGMSSMPQAMPADYSRFAPSNYSQPGSTYPLSNNYPLSNYDSERKSQALLPSNSSGSGIQLAQYLQPSGGPQYSQPGGVQYNQSGQWGFSGGSTPNIPQGGQNGPFPSQVGMAYFQPGSMQCGPGGNPNQCASGSSSTSSGPRIQIRFNQPIGMKVAWVATGPDGRPMYSEYPLITPGSYNFVQGAGAIYRLKLTNIDQHPELTVYPTMEVMAFNSKSEAFLSHASIPLDFTDEDFKQITEGNYVVKVIYLPDPQFQDLAGTGTNQILSTRLEPGVDPVQEARRRGTVLLVIRMGNLQQELNNTPGLNPPSVPRGGSGTMGPGGSGMMAPGGSGMMGPCGPGMMGPGGPGMMGPGGPGMMAPGGSGMMGSGNNMMPMCPPAGYPGSAWVPGPNGFNSNISAPNSGGGSGSGGYGYGIQNAAPLVQIPMYGMYGGPGGSGGSNCQQSCPPPGYLPQMGGANMTNQGTHEDQSWRTQPPWKGGPLLPPLSTFTNPGGRGNQSGPSGSGGQMPAISPQYPQGGGPVPQSTEPPDPGKKSSESPPNPLSPPTAGNSPAPGQPSLSTRSKNDPSSVQWLPEPLQLKNSAPSPDSVALPSFSSSFSPPPSAALSPEDNAPSPAAGSPSTPTAPSGPAPKKFEAPPSSSPTPIAPPSPASSPSPGAGSPSTPTAPSGPAPDKFEAPPSSSPIPPPNFTPENFQAPPAIPEGSVNSTLPNQSSVPAVVPASHSTGNLPNNVQSEPIMPEVEGTVAPPVISTPARTSATNRANNQAPPRNFVIPPPPPITPPPQ